MSAAAAAAAAAAATLLLAVSMMTVNPDGLDSKRGRNHHPGRCGDLLHQHQHQHQQQKGGEQEKQQRQNHVLVLVLVLPAKTWSAQCSASSEGGPLQLQHNVRG